jgi:hypothetical protein
VRGIVELTLGHRRGLWDGRPEHGLLVVVPHRVDLGLGRGYLAIVVHGDGARQRDALEFGTQADGRAPAEQQ